MGMAPIKSLVFIINRNSGLRFFSSYNPQMHNYIATVYITTVYLCNLYSCMFRHCHVTIREFTTSALLSYTRSDVDRKVWKHVGV
jgi:hypothetical protein